MVQPLTRGVLIGTVIGDGYLERHGKGVRLEVIHSNRYKKYVEWKHKILSELTPGPLYHRESPVSYWRFLTRSHPFLEYLREIFYEDNRKIILVDINKLLIRPLSLAVWFMDDGTLDKSHGSILFETQSYSIDDIFRLSNCLKKNFGLCSSIHRSGRNRGLRLYIPVREAKKLSRLIKRFILPCMAYKLSIPL